MKIIPLADRVVIKAVEVEETETYSTMARISP